MPRERITRPEAGRWGLVEQVAQADRTSGWRAMQALWRAG